MVLQFQIIVDYIQELQKGTEMYGKGTGMTDTKSITIRSPNYHSHKNGSGKNNLSKIVGKM